MSKTKIKEWETDYKLVPMPEITDEAREIAVRWMECDDKNWIGNKHKLASDIMNYARRHSESKEKEIEQLKQNIEENNKWYFANLELKKEEIESLKDRIAEIVYLSEQPGGYHP